MNLTWIAFKAHSVLSNPIQSKNKWILIETVK